MLEQMRILCRADGNSHIGLGHLYRMIAIAGFYQSHYEVVFITSELSELSVIPEKFNLELIPKFIDFDKESKWLNEHFNSKSDILVYDGYQFISSYQKEVKAFNFKSIYIDDNASEYMYADIVVNPASIANLSVYHGEPYTEYLSGTKYSMLRPKFCELAGKTREIYSLGDVFICFGGSDPLNLTKMATLAAMSLGNHFESINVVFGSSNINSELIEAAKANDKLNIYNGLSESELVELMLKCDLAIVPASTISYELCCINMVILLGYYVQNQKLIYENLVSNDAVFACDDFSKYSTSDFEFKIRQVLKEKGFEKKLSNQASLFDGRSKGRFLALIKRLQMTFRRMDEKDLNVLYKWTNDKMVRANSYDNSIISYEDHSSWFKKKLLDDKALILIVMIGDKEAGVVRYEFADNYTTVGVSIAQEFRGQNLASTMLRQSVIKFADKIIFPVIANIKVENTASINAFLNAGYYYYQNKIVKGANSYVYKLEKKDVCK